MIKNSVFESFIRNAERHIPNSFPKIGMNANLVHMNSNAAQMGWHEKVSNH